MGKLKGWVWCWLEVWKAFQQQTLWMFKHPNPSMWELEYFHYKKIPKSKSSFCVWCDSILPILLVGVISFCLGWIFHDTTLFGKYESSFGSLYKQTSLNRDYHAKRISYAMKMDFMLMSDGYGLQASGFFTSMIGPLQSNLKCARPCYSGGCQVAGKGD